MGLFSKKKDKQKKLRSFTEINNDTVADDFSVQEKKTCTDPYLLSAPIYAITTPLVAALKMA